MAVVIDEDGSESVAEEGRRNAERDFVRGDFVILRQQTVADVGAEGVEVGPRKAVDDDDRVEEEVDEEKEEEERRRPKRSR